MKELTGNTAIKQREVIRPGCRLDLMNLPKYDNQDHDLSVRMANQFSLWLEDMKIPAGELVIRDEYDEEEGGLLHYLAKVKVGQENAKLNETVSLSQKYSFIEEGVQTEGSVKVTTRLPTGISTETYQKLETLALDKYKVLLEEYYPEMVTTYDPDGARIALVSVFGD